LILNSCYISATQKYHTLPSLSHIGKKISCSNKIWHCNTRNQYGLIDKKLTAGIIITKKPQFQYKPSDLRSTVKIENSVKLWLLLQQLTWIPHIVDGYILPNASHIVDDYISLNAWVAYYVVISYVLIVFSCLPSKRIGCIFGKLYNICR
jgi:hypothetical protein